MKTTEHITQSIITYIRENFPRARQTELTGEEDLFETGIIDSLGILSIIGFIEEKYTIQVNDVDIVPEHFTTIAAIARYVSNASNGAVSDGAVLQSDTNSAG
ncbi:MAG TPA: acyl carrier protein [bacterium]|nr:acyl carrier protein [bacterium]